MLHTENNKKLLCIINNTIFKKVILLMNNIKYQREQFLLGRTCGYSLSTCLMALFRKIYFKNVTNIEKFKSHFKIIIKDVTVRPPACLPAWLIRRRTLRVEATKQ